MEGEKPRQDRSLECPQRAKYAANKEKEHARAKAWREAHKADRNASYKLWAKRNRSKLREKWRERGKDPVIAERRRQLRRKRMQDPQRRKHVNWQKRFYYQQHKYDRIGIRAMIRQEWLEKWKSVVAAGEERIEKYLKRCGVRVKTFFGKWRRAGMPDDIDEILEVLGYGKS